MENVINCINKFISRFSKVVIVIWFTIILIGMICFNSVYLYIDAPEIRLNSINNYLAIVVCIVGIAIMFLIRKKMDIKKINIPSKWRKIIFCIAFLTYFILEVVYIKIIPLKPFSDMESVCKIAMSNFAEGIAYLQIYPNNLPITLLFNLIFRITIYDVIVIKILNIICNILTIYFAYKTFKNLYKKESVFVLVFGLTYIPVMLYVNNVYNDLIFTTLTTIILYQLTKEKKKKFDFLFTAILLFIQYSIRPVGIILIIAAEMYYLFKEKNWKKFLFVIVIFVSFSIVWGQVEKNIIPKSNEVKKYPIWSFIQMGINEKEYGFQDGSHSAEWTSNGVIERIKELGPKRLVKLVSKKMYWQWTEGTYQVERYAFGIWRNQHEYETFATQEVSDIENSKVRKTLEYVMKGQYFVMIGLSLIGILVEKEEKKLNEKRDLLFYFIIGMFCFYVIWEMKSRYIYCLYPVFLILAVNGFEELYRKKLGLSPNKMGERKKLKWENSKE